MSDHPQADASEVESARELAERVSHDLYSRQNIYTEDWSHWDSRMTPALRALLESRDRAVAAAAVEPFRELAEQTEEHARMWREMGAPERASAQEDLAHAIRELLPPAAGKETACEHMGGWTWSCERRAYCCSCGMAMLDSEGDPVSAEACVEVARVRQKKAGQVAGKDPSE